MQISLVSNQFWVTPSVREYVMFKVRANFFSLKGRRPRISVVLRNLGNKDDGRENACRISVLMPDQPEILTEDVQENMYAAIDAAVKKAAHRAKRILTCRHPSILRSISAGPENEVGD